MEFNFQSKQRNTILDRKLLRLSRIFIVNKCTKKKIVFSRKFVDLLNPFIGCQQNLRKNTILIIEILYHSLSGSNIKKIIIGLFVIQTKILLK